MDHLPHPQGAQVQRHERVPLVCDPSLLDCGSFLTYPSRARPPRPQYLRTPETPDVLRAEQAKPIPTRELEVFFQTWLFFGLLQGVFGQAYSWKSFVYSVDCRGEEMGFQTASAQSQTCCTDERSHQHFVSTRSLVSMLEAWTNEMTQCSRDERIERSHHVCACVSLTRYALRVAQPGMPAAHAEFSPLIRNSIAAVAEAIMLTARNSYSSLSEDEVFNFTGAWKMFYFDDEVVLTMKANGWCPSEVERVQNSASNLATLYYMSRLKNFEGPGDHSKCAALLCVADQSLANDVVPQHRERGCKCEPYTIDALKVEKILREGLIPLLRIKFGGSENEPPVVDIVPAHKSISYVAISHIWAEGLGNSTANAIPRCQLSNLKNSIAALQFKFGFRPTDAVQRYRRASWSLPNGEDLKISPFEHHNSEQMVSPGDEPTEYIEYRETPNRKRAYPASSIRLRRSESDLKLPVNANMITIDECDDVANWELLLWLDTLCCPVQPQDLKQLALQRMRDVYAQASGVLVLDATMQKLDCLSVDDYETFGQLITSKWSRRLWTLQEGYLAANLWVQCRDTVFFMTARYRDILNGHRSNVMLRALAQGFYHFIYAIRPISVEYLLDVAESGRYRSVSVPSDEPLCIATLINLDIASVLRHDTRELRMAQLWRLLSAHSSGIPRSAIFHHARRLTEPGFRWAPITLLETSQETTDCFYHDITAGELTPQGLKVRFPAFRFAFQPKLLGLAVDAQDDPSQWLEETLLLRGNDRNWFFVSLVDNNLRNDMAESLQSIMREKHTKEFVVIMSADPVDSEATGDRSVEGLIGTIDRPSPEVTIIRSAALATVRLLHRSYSVLYEASHISAEGLRNGDIGRELSQFVNNQDAPGDSDARRNAVDHLIEQIESIAEQHSKSSALADAIGGRRFAMSADAMRSKIGESLRGQHGLIVEEYSSEQEWCVD